MTKLRMTQDTTCDNCNQDEDIKHQLHDCQTVRRLWQFFNSVVTTFGRQDMQVFNFVEAVTIPHNSHLITETFKSIILKFCIQIQRPNPNSISQIYSFTQNYFSRELFILKKKPDKNSKKINSILKFLRGLETVYRHR